MPDSNWPPADKAEVRAEYRKLVGEMKAAGAKLCADIVHDKLKHLRQQAAEHAGRR
jgi:hypothetical protein